ncbi:MAG: hypothetical protein E6K32_02010 [Gammaproteobacteria bacterium]|nr:MAG: hypothetical protein E6K32_02010 [Gammaproteobacteria bacterium]
MDLSRKRDRERLKVRHDPYWQRLGKGAALGFRRGADTWLARFRGRDGRQQFQALGEALEYDEAKRRAEEWMGQLGRTAVRSVKRATVREALEAYPRAGGCGPGCRMALQVNRLRGRDRRRAARERDPR